MKLGLILFSFFITSALLLFVSIEKNSEVIYAEQIKKMKVSKLQTSSAKRYMKSRKLYVPERSFSLAKEEIDNILLKNPIRFEVNNSSPLLKSTLIEIVKIVNNVKDDVVLSILAHSDAEGTAKHNLILSQKKADRLKEYFIDKTNLPLVVAIGYGEVFALKNRLIEINLKRIKE